MRLLAFSDWRVQDIDSIFNFIKGLDKPVDFIVYGGDDVARFEDNHVNYFTELAKYTTQKKVLAVAGNDDLPIVKRVLKNKNVHDLYEKHFVFENYAFLGLEASTSGPAILKHTEKEVMEHLKEQHSKVKKKNVIILSHTPPYGILDYGIRFASLDEGSHHIGSTSLTKFVQTNKVSLVICGHCHSQGGFSSRLGNTHVVNVSSHDNRGAKGNFAIIETGNNRNVSIEWHDTFEQIEQNSVRRLHGIGEVRSSYLKSNNIKTLEDLVGIRDLDQTAARMGVSANFLWKLQLKAKSVLENKPYWISPFEYPKGNLIFFDIETDIACRKVWLIGTLKNGKFRNFFARNWNEEKENLENFLDFLGENGDSTLVSFSGINFDRNVLLRALQRLSLNGDILSSLPHVDLCQVIRRSFIFPNQSFALKDLGSHLGYPFKHPDISGLFVAIEYQRHLDERRKLDRRVLDYNEDDVKALPFLIDKIMESKFEYVKNAFQPRRIRQENTMISQEVGKETEIIQEFRKKGYTLQEISDKLDKSVYYVFSRLNFRYMPSRSHKKLKK